jgi:hypothetical protein
VKGYISALQRAALEHHDVICVGLMIGLTRSEVDAVLTAYTDKMRNTVESPSVEGAKMALYDALDQKLSK